MGHPMLCTELSKSHPMQANEGDPTFIVVVSVVSVTSLDCCYHYQKTGSKNKGKEKCVAKKKKYHMLVYLLHVRILQQKTTISVISA